MASQSHLTESSRNNDVPSESELHEAFELRSKLQEDLLQIDTEIRLLEEKRAAVLKSIDIYNLILSAVRRLPPDILREIFYHSLPTDRNPTLSATEAPLLLTCVCSTWRAIALTSTQIWAKLHIVLPGNPILSSAFGTLTNDALKKRRQVFSQLMELRCRVVKDWLMRSGTCPLSISVSYPLGYVDAHDNSGNRRQFEPDDIAEPLFQLILSFSPRWNHIDLSMPFSVYKQLESYILGDDLPLLRSLRGNILWDDAVSDLQSSNTVSEHSDHLPIRFLEAPNLRSLSLNSLYLTHTIPILPPMWGRLTDLYLRSTILELEFLDIVRLCHNLVTCQVEEMHVPWDNPVQEFRPLTEVILPNLEMMKIRESGGVSSVLQAISMPSLKSLSYSCPPRYLEHQPPSLIRADTILSLVEKWASTLQKLTLEPEYLRSEDTVTCLRFANEVSHLVLNCTPYYFVGNSEDDIRGDDLFDLDLLKIYDNPFTPASSQDILLPKLEILEVYDLRKFADEAILGLLTNRINTARRGVVSPLRRVKLQMLRQRQRDIRDEVFEVAKSTGFELKLDLIYPPDAPPYNGRLSPSFLSYIPFVNPLEETWPPTLYSLDG